MFHVSVIDSSTTTVVYGTSFGGMHPILMSDVQYYKTKLS